MSVRAEWQAIKCPAPSSNLWPRYTWPQPCADQQLRDIPGRSTTLSKCRALNASPATSIPVPHKAAEPRSTAAEHTSPSPQAALGVIVIIPDTFGVDFVNNQIPADHYSSAGQYLVYLPDFLDGNAAPARTMINMAHMFDEKESMLSKPYYLIATMFDFVPFLIRNRLGTCWPRVTSFLSALRNDEGASLPVGVAGFCWGGQYAIKLSHDTSETRTTADGRPIADAFFTAHLSGVTVAPDFEAVKRPLSVAIGDDDAVMGIAQVRQAEKILAKKADVKSEVIIYPGAKHGFSIRASRTKPDSTETRQAEEAEKQAVAWFQGQFAAVRNR